MDTFEEIRAIIAKKVERVQKSIDIMNMFVEVKEVLETMSPEDFPLCPENPYSRTILCIHPQIEIMVARWSYHRHCAPHDHGMAHSLIYILSGSATHRLYSICSDTLEVVHEETKEKGEYIRCVPKQVHSMGADPDLLTFHMYSPSITDMFLYDLSSPNTWVVRGACGAWLPVERKEDVFLQRSGHYVRARGGS